ncbi:MAG: hypothetical protein Q8M40_02830 [Legionella sp.]|nr:hypothetical protein [Legionella sp.]
MKKSSKVSSKKQVKEKINTDDLKNISGGGCSRHERKNVVGCDSGDDGTSIPRRR